MSLLWWAWTMVQTIPQLWHLPVPKVLAVKALEVRPVTRGECKIGDGAGTRGRVRGRQENSGSGCGRYRTCSPSGKAGGSGHVWHGSIPNQLQITLTGADDIACTLPRPQHVLQPTLSSIDRPSTRDSSCRCFLTRPIWPQRPLSSRTRCLRTDQSVIRYVTGSFAVFFKIIR